MPRPEGVPAHLHVLRRRVDRLREAYVAARAGNVPHEVLARIEAGIRVHERDLGRAAADWVRTGALPEVVAWRFPDRQGSPIPRQVRMGDIYQLLVERPDGWHDTLFPGCVVVYAVSAGLWEVLDVLSAETYERERAAGDLP